LNPVVKFSRIYQAALEYPEAQFASFGNKAPEELPRLMPVPLSGVIALANAWLQVNAEMNCRPPCLQHSYHHEASHQTFWRLRSAVLDPPLTPLEVSLKIASRSMIFRRVLSPGS
jgi:hypothetical protein